MVSKVRRCLDCLDKGECRSTMSLVSRYSASTASFNGRREKQMLEASGSFLLHG